MADDMSMNLSRGDFEALLDESMGGRDFAEGTVVKGLVAAIEKLARPRPHLPKDYALNHGHYVGGEPKK